MEHRIESQPVLRKTRFVCVSDTHNASPEDGAFKLPKGDVLIHAGDLTKQGTLAELRKTLDWIEEADFEEKLVVAGNHDISLDHAFYGLHGSKFHNQNPQDSANCSDLIRAYKSIRFLNHEAATVRLIGRNGPRTQFRVFGSPYSPTRGSWAFDYAPEDAKALWSQIPLETDILITHTPPKNHCDRSKEGESIGCEILRQALWRIRPTLAVCGHVHEARGVERVTWDLNSPKETYKESATDYWADPGLNNKKQSLMNLASAGPAPVRNTGPFEQNTLHYMAENRQDPTHSQSTSRLIRGDAGLLESRIGRQETCIVNAAIMATSWPYKAGNAGRKYNKPIVVDMDLPSWEIEMTQRDEIGH